jgi:nitrite reductase (NADH) large subunit
VVEGPGNGIHRRLILSRGRLVGAVAIGDWPEQARIHGAILQRRRLWAWEQARFRRTGLLWPGRRAIPVAEWPESALVCNCLGVRRGALSAACAAGCATVEALALATGASSVCGSCRPLLAGLLGAPATTGPVPGSRALLAAAVLVLPVLAGLAFLSPFPPSDSIQNAPAIGLLWHSTPVRRVTGFSLLGVVVLSLLLSARKRIARFRSGSVGAWRAIHAGLGLASLLGLATHTGLRLGENLNRVLMLDFLALALAGSLAGLVTALERRLDGPTSRRLRAGWTLTHIVLTWPLPVLVGFHILATYYY